MIPDISEDTIKDDPVQKIELYYNAHKKRSLFKTKINLILIILISLCVLIILSLILIHLIEYKSNKKFKESNN